MAKQKHTTKLLLTFTAFLVVFVVALAVFTFAQPQVSNELSPILNQEQVEVAYAGTSSGKATQGYQFIPSDISAYNSTSFFLRVK